VKPKFLYVLLQSIPAHHPLFHFYPHNDKNLYNRARACRNRSFWESRRVPNPSQNASPVPAAVGLVCRDPGTEEAGRKVTSDADYVKFVALQQGLWDEEEWVSESFVVWRGRDCACDLGFV
jgi:hypothetical protein